MNNTFSGKNQLVELFMFLIIIILTRCFPTCSQLLAPSLLLLIWARIGSLNLFHRLKLFWASPRIVLFSF